MEYTESVQKANDRLWEMLYKDKLLTKVLLASLICFCIYLLIYFIIKRIKRRWSCLYLVFVTVCVALWSALTLISVFQTDVTLISLLTSVSGIALIPIPVLISFHIREQVSISDDLVFFSIIFITLPVILLVLVLVDLVFNDFNSFRHNIDSEFWPTLIFYVYAFAALIRAYMSCFNVMFQMPKHTRRSTKSMIVGVTAIFSLLLIHLFWNKQLSGLVSNIKVESTLIKDFDIVSLLVPLGAPTLFLVMLHSMYNALNSISSTEVIVTSRQLVVSGITTALLILNKDDEILDWNQKDWSYTYPLPKPLFREPLAIYRKRLQESNNCRISAHNEDVIIFEEENAERHFLMQIHEIVYDKKKYGRILEISEITPVYTMLRHFEDIVTYDYLTNLHSRNSYINMVNQIVKEENMPLVIFIGDVNGLKYTNDTYGHQMGDELLITVSDIIRKVQPPGSFAARVGGDEFVLLIPGGSAEIADKFVQDVIVMCSQINHEVFGTPSISWGYSIMKSADQTYNDVFSEADAIMYEYKRTRHAFRSSGLVPDVIDERLLP